MSEMSDPKIWLLTILRININYDSEYDDCSNLKLVSFLIVII